MRKALRVIAGTLLLACGWVFFPCFSYAQSVPKTNFRFPFQAAGLSERQAAAHLLSRFTYGATLGQIDAVVKQGPENWFRQQLDAQLPDDSLEALLGQFDALNLSNAQILALYPKPGQVLHMAIKDGVIHKDSAKNDNKEYKKLLQQYMEQRGLKPQQDLFRQFIGQKILRAAYSHNQLQEVMTGFWFNHFNVSITKSNCARFVPAYERDVIRPNALGRFGDLLLATAKSPAMLYYLDNFSSTASNEGMVNKRPKAAIDKGQKMEGGTADTLSSTPLKVKKARGLNENYSREVMELHTLGVNAGYSQQDVTEAARVLTGWTVYAMQASVERKSPDRAGNGPLEKRGFVHEGDFLFAAGRHDKGRKTIMGRQFGPDGYEEGVAFLEMLARDTSTAQFISRKLAVRFVSDNPPQALINKMAKTFIEKDGNIKAVLMAMVTSTDFWDTAAIRQKTKSPFELAVGTVRNLNACIDDPDQLYRQISKMGEKMYYYQAPTGFPDRAQYWINTGSLLNRMNFGLAIANGRVPGLTIDLAALNKYHEPESAQAALAAYGRIMMPERDLDQTIQRLTPLLNDPGLAKKVKAASIKTPVPSSGAKGTEEIDQPKVDKEQGTNNEVNSSVLAQVVGIIIGSPEYQRR